MKKVNISTIKGIKKHKSVVIPVGTELNTEITSYGFIEIILNVHGASGLIHIAGIAAIQNNAIVSDPRKILSIQTNEAAKICFYRKTDNGSIFIKNNTAYQQTIGVYYSIN